MKITPAMKEWCKFISKGGRIEKLSLTSYFCLGRAGFTYKMGIKLCDAGLVLDIKNGYLALTEKGKSVCA